MRDTILSERMVLRGHLHRAGNQRGAEMAGHRPPDDFLAEAVDDGGEIDFSLPGPDLGDVADELAVGGGGGEVPLDQVGDRGDVGGLRGQRPGLADLAGHEAQVAHEAADELAGGLLALAGQLGVDAPVPVGLVVVVEDLLYLSLQVFLSYRGRGQRPVFPFVVAGFRHAYPQAHLREGRSISRRRGHIGGVLRCDERVLVAHCCSDAKYAATFSRKVTFCRSSRTSRSASRSRARSDSSSGGSSPACLSRYARTQFPSVVSLTPLPRATEAMDRELSTTSRAASSRNSGVKFFFLPAIYTQPFRMDPTGGPQSGRLGAPQMARSAARQGNLAMRIRDELGEVYADARFTAAFGVRGRPGISPGQLMMASVLQFSENLTDRQAAEAVRDRMTWKYALGLELEDPGFDASVLSEFRSRLVAGDLTSLALDALLERLAGLGLVRAGGRQRTDSA